MFKKGKASFNAKINPKSRGAGWPPFRSFHVLTTFLVHKTQHFSEFSFLNNTRKVPEKAVSEPSSDDSDSTATSVKEVLKTNPKVKSRQAIITQPASEISRIISASEKLPRVESEIWDIESRASEKRKITEEKTGSVDEASAIDNQGTVVVDTRAPAWSDRVAKATGMDPAKRTSEKIPDPIPSSPSLRPSQSASQIGNFKCNPAEAASRYFPVTQHKQSTPPQPDCAASKPLSSLSRDLELVEKHQDLERDDVLPASDAVPPTRFVVPTRNRVFSRQFQGVRLQSQGLCIYPSAVDGFQVVYEGSEVLDQYAYLAPEMSPEILESGYEFDDDPAEQYSAHDQPLYCDTQLGHPQSGEGWDAAIQVLNGPWANVYDAGLEGFALEYGKTLEPEPEYMDPVEDGDGYLAAGYAESDSGAFHGYCDALFVNVEEEVNGPLSNGGFDDWEEATENSLYLAVDDQNDSMDDAPDGQDLPGFPTEHPTGGIESDDIISDCSDPVSVYAPRFAQGRALLLGLPLHESTGRIAAPPYFSSAEVDVVKALRGHWLPQRL